MNEQAVGAASPAGTLLRPIPVRSRGAVQRGWEPSPSRLSMKDTLTAGAFLAVYLAAYLAAGYVGVTFVEWAWMRIFG